METIVSLIFDIGLTLGVGSSTFALLFFILALRDGVIDDSEKRLMHAVYAVLRIGMVLIVLGLASSLLFGTHPALLTGGMSLSGQYLMQWTLMGVIVVNAILMTKHLMPMKYGPTLAGGSWYSLFLVSSLPLVSHPYWQIFIGYLLFLVVFYLVFNYLKNKYVPTKPPAPQQ